MSINMNLVITTLNRSTSKSGMVMIEPLVPVFEVPHRVVVVTFFRTDVTRWSVRLGDDTGCVCSDDCYFLWEKRLGYVHAGDCGCDWGGRGESRDVEWHNVDIVLCNRQTCLRASLWDIGVNKRLTRVVNLGNTKLGFNPFLTSISPCNVLTNTIPFAPLSSTVARPSPGSGQKNAFPTCSRKVLLLRRGAVSLEASEPIAIDRVRWIAAAVGEEKRSRTTSSRQRRVRRRGIGELSA